MSQTYACHTIRVINADIHRIHNSLYLKAKKFERIIQPLYVCAEKWSVIQTLLLLIDFLDMIVVTICVGHSVSLSNEQGIAYTNLIFHDYKGMINFVKVPN